MVLGVGLVGMQVARLLRDLGYSIVGTTTGASRIPDLEKYCHEAIVLRLGHVAVPAIGPGAHSVLGKLSAKLESLAFSFITVFSFSVAVSLVSPFSSGL